MDSFYEKNKHAVQNFAILSAAILGCFLFFRYLFPIFLPFFFGWLLSLLFRPLADKLETHGVARWVGAMLGILLFLTTIGLLGYFVGRELREQLQNLIAMAPAYINKLQVSLADFWIQLDGYLVDLPDMIKNITGYVKDELYTILLSLAQSFGSSSASSAISAVPRFLLGFLIALFSSYFFTKDRLLIHRAYVAHVEPLLGLSLESTKKELATSLWGYVKTQFILMAFVFVVCWIGMEILRSPYAFLLSVVIAIIDAFPFFGSGFILWPAAFMQLISGNTALGIGYLVIYALVQILRQLMQPKILGMQIGLHPLLTLFSMYFGYKCIGFFGLILGPVLVVILRTFFRIRQENKNQ